MIEQSPEHECRYKEKEDWPGQACQCNEESEQVVCPSLLKFARDQVEADDDQWEEEVFTHHEDVQVDIRVVECIDHGCNQGCSCVGEFFCRFKNKISAQSKNEGMDDRQEIVLQVIDPKELEDPVPSGKIDVIERRPRGPHGHLFSIDKCICVLVIERHV